MSNDRILVNSNKEDDTFLRQKTKEVDLTTFSAGERKKLIDTMKRAMRQAKGVGLSANQIGLPHRIFVAEVPGPDNRPKFYAVFNPKIEKYSDDKEFMEEGCLSVPGTYGEVKRSLQVVLRGLDKNGKVLKLKAWGLLAHVFQHEIDHLDGKLFIDKAKTLRQSPQSERLQKRTEEVGKSPKKRSE